MPRSVPDPRPDPAADRVLVVATPARAVDLMRLAVLRSDDVRFVAETVSPEAQRLALRFAIEVEPRSFVPDDLAGTAAVLVALDDREAENRIVRAARRRGVPVHVSDRPLVSDFSVLAMLEQPGLLRPKAA